MEKGLRVGDSVRRLKEFANPVADMVLGVVNCQASVVSMAQIRSLKPQPPPERVPSTLCLLCEQQVPADLMNVLGLALMRP